MNKFCRAINRINRSIVWKNKRKSLKNKNFTIISNTCWPGFVYHDLGLRFDTPTINLSIPINDFLKFVENLKYYERCEMVETENPDRTYPVGKLGDITINFVHYHDFSFARTKFQERFTRIHEDNLFVICVAPVNCPDSLIEDFSKIHIENKVIITSKDYPNVGCAFHLHGHNGINEISSYVSGQLSGRRYIDEFDVIDFLNKDKYGDTQKQ